MSRKKSKHEESEGAATSVAVLVSGTEEVVDEVRLLADVRGLILATREHVALYVNQETTLLYWDVGARIRQEVLGFERAAYGQRVVENLARELTREFGRGYGWRNLFNMVRFAEEFPDRKILQTLSAILSWSHFIELLRIDDPLARAFYTELTRLHRWGVRPLRNKICSRLYDRSVLSRKPEELIAEELAQLRNEDRLTVNMVLRDPYLLSALDSAKPIVKRNSKMLSSGRWRRSCLKSGTGSPLSPARRSSPARRAAAGCGSWTSCSTTVSCGGWSPSNSRSARSNRSGYLPGREGCGTDGVLPALAGPQRAGNGRGAAYRSDPV